MPSKAIDSLISRYQTMEPVEEKERAKLLDSIEELIVKLGVHPTPIHYTVIFEALSKIDPFLSKQIMESIDKNQYNNEVANLIFSNLFVQYLYEHLPTNQVEELLENLLHQIENWQTNTDKNQKNLMSSIEEITNSDIPDRIKIKLTQEVLPAIQSLIGDTEGLKNQASKASNKIYTLKKELDQAKSIALTDDLTQIPNRRGFNQAVENMIKKTEKGDFGFSLVLVDIDFFKTINDRFGHNVGDSVLRYIAKQFEKDTKGKDFIARLGGEEFVILLADTNYANALSVAENLRRRIEKIKLKVVHNHEDLTITVSCGVATFKKQESLEELTDRADKALYEAKNSGRNMVKGEQDLPTTVLD